MISYTVGDILEDEAEAIVNSVNCVGVMGRGLALQFKRVYPDNFRAYASACANGEVKPGRLFTFATDRARPRYIINFPTKRHWRHRSRLEDIEAGLDALVVEIQRLGLASVAIPPLGSGLGGLDWPRVKDLITDACARLQGVRVVVYEPWREPQAVSARRAPKAPTMTPGRATLVGLMQRYLAGLMDPFISLLEVHKLMYFMQEAGEPLRLHYVKGPYGPYAENLRHVLHHIEGYLVSGYGDGGDDPGKPLTLLPGATQDAERLLAQTPETRARFDRVSELVEGFETSFGLELLSTVHWLLREGEVHDADDLIAAVYAWGRRKRRFAPEQILLARRHLEALGWTPAGLIVAPGRGSRPRS